MSAEFYNLVGQVGAFVSATPAVNLSGAAKDDHVTFVTDVTDGATVYVMIKKDATNLLVWEATFADLATDTLTRVTELTAIGTIADTDAVDCYLINPAELIKRGHEDAKGFISGLELDYNAGTLKCLEGQAVVDGELLTIAAAGTTTISGDALGTADAIFYIYIYDNAGTVQMHREQRIAGSDDPVWDTDLDYAKHPVDGAAKRCIGAIYVGQTVAGTMEPFEYIARGRSRTYWSEDLIRRVVGSGSATTPKSTDCSASIPSVSILKRCGFKLHVANQGTGSTQVVFIIWAQTSAGCTNNTGLQVSAEMDTASGAAALGPMLMPIINTTLFYKVNDAGVDGFVDVYQWEMFV